MPNFAITNHVNVNLNNIMSMKILAVVKEKFFSLQNLLVGIDSDSMISVHHQNLHFTIGLGTVIGKSDLSPHPEKYIFNCLFKKVLYLLYLAASTQNSSLIWNM